ncbi:c2h2 transcription factor [Grosmannia clavigera kw1407]|uniref:C2h2 transcription factor n=1 Tax=Grosmannia clavigera (strain kw1407 / UAMH 11150) TaxID=655863 RepID=F0XR36_GROCL|nr:c2h2 transcription factor [Grosmannia clavigera kw1407]EFW99970.1 c2h2 transcription factor [Grosmannia clavigera kw1407]
MPRLETHRTGGLHYSSMNSASGLPLFSPNYSFEGAGFGNSNSNTINPSALRYTDSPQALALDPTSAFVHGVGGYRDMSSTQDSFDWLTGFENQLSFDSAVDENAIDESSPSAMSTTSQSGISDIMLDGSTHMRKHSTSVPPVSSDGTTSTSLPLWQQDSSIHQQMINSGFSLDISSATFSDLLSGFSSMSPHAPTSQLGNQNGQNSLNSVGTVPSSNRNMDTYFSTPPPSLSSLSPSLLTTMNPANLSQTFGFGVGAAPHTPTSLNGSHNSGEAFRTNNMPVSTITDATRNAIINALNSSPSQSSSFGTRKFSFSGSGSPSSTLQSAFEYQVPSTSDLQRYVGAYLRYFQPHYPFLHVATLSFEISSDMSSPSTVSGSDNGQAWRSNDLNGAVGGSGCLSLSMAAIGALYELEHERSRVLFTMSKRMIQLYLDDRRKSHVRNAHFRRASSVGVNGQPQQTDNLVDTPVWLVQAMLLNVVYGHNGSDKRAGEIASTHCAALVSLAQGANLLRPVRVEPDSEDLTMTMGDDIDDGSLWSGNGTKTISEEELWLKWRDMEERKRTLYAIFTMSSFLVSSYNHTPALTNSELLLDLPCDEEFFAAPTCSDFMALGGVAAANHNRMTMHEALGNLLRASEKQVRRVDSELPEGRNDVPAELKPSAFGCFILINALHNYIWETRQRHHNKIWTNEETEKMHRHIEPALQAWQRAWASNPRPRVELPNTFALGALATDSIPLLDLAYVRLFVNMSRSKEMFWQRDWDGLAEELSHGREIVQHAENSPASIAESVLTDASSDLTGSSSSGHLDSPATQHSSTPDFAAAQFSLATAAQTQINAQQAQRATSRREKHLRKAAFYAADSLSMTDKLGFTLADFSNRELPLQSALCAFDCAQVLGEWVATLQDRIGRYLGILGHDDVDLGQVPAIMLLEDEDIKLLNKIQDMLSTAEMKMNLELANGSIDSVGGISGRLAARMQLGEQIGYAAKILSVTAYMLGKAGVWPVTHLMAECLENHAGHMRSRAEKSVVASD